MSRMRGYYARISDARTDLSGLPAWARTILLIFALPGIIALVLSFVALIVSIVALLLLTVPVYVLLRAITGANGGVSGEASLVINPGPNPEQVKHVDATIRDADQGVPDEVDGE